MKIAIKKPSQPLSVIDTTEISEYIEDILGAPSDKGFLKINNQNLYVVADKEAINYGDKPINFYTPLENSVITSYPLAGNVVFFRKKNLPTSEVNDADQLEFDDLTEFDIKYIENLLTENFQKELAKKRKELAANIF